MWLVLPALAVAISIAALPIARVSGWPTILILLLAFTLLALLYDVDTLRLIRRRHLEESRGKLDFATATQREPYLLSELQKRADAAILNRGTMKSALESILSDLREIVPFDAAHALVLVAPGRLWPMAEVGPEWPAPSQHSAGRMDFQPVPCNRAGLCEPTTSRHIQGRDTLTFRRQPTAYQEICGRSSSHCER